jgi:hypothetical protein
MFSTRKLSPLAFATAAASAVLVMIATPLTASADSPWDGTRPIVTASESALNGIVAADDDDDSPWDRIQVVAGDDDDDDDSPWD